MIKLEDKSNVNAPSVPYPYGSLRNNPGDNTGTPVNVNLVGDVMQLMEKIMAESGITPNGLPDNEANGWQLYEALKLVGYLGKGYKAYIANLTQTGSSAPTVTPIVNEIGAIIWTRSGVGEYVGTLAGAFPVGKIICFVQQSSNGFPRGFINCGPFGTNVINLRTFDTSGVAADGLFGTINTSSLEIRVYD